MSGTILLVEDDQNDAFFMQRAAKTAGLVNPIHVAQDGQGAVDYLEGAGEFGNRKQFPLPCLVLLDLKLPYVPGLDVLRYIRRQPELGVIVLILTSSSAQADIAAAYRLGANGYLVKPSCLAQFVDLAKAIKDFWLIHNLPPPIPLGARGLETPAQPHAQSLERNCSPALTGSLAQSPSTPSPTAIPHTHI